MNCDGALSLPRFCTWCAPSPMSSHGQALKAVSHPGPMCSTRVVLCLRCRHKVKRCKHRDRFVLRKAHSVRICSARVAFCLLRQAGEGRTLGSSSEGLSVAHAAASAAVILVDWYALHAWTAGVSLGGNRSVRGRSWQAARVHPMSWCVCSCSHSNDHDGPHPRPACGWCAVAGTGWTTVLGRRAVPPHSGTPHPTTSATVAARAARRPTIARHSALVVK